MSVYTGVNFNNLRKALYLMFFGVDLVKDRDGNEIALSQDFSSPKYRYIIPMQGNFDNPLQDMSDGELAKNTFIEYWIESDKSLTQDDYTEENGIPVNRQKCVATVLLRFIGKDAETWVKSLRHLTKRSGIGEIWSGVCNAEELEYTMPITPRRINFFGKNSQIAFDVRFKLYYDESISTGWQPLTGIDFDFVGSITVEDK
jgi:hypothetical protein